MGVKSGFGYGEGSKDGKCEQSGIGGVGNWRDGRVKGIELGGAKAEKICERGLGRLVNELVGRWYVVLDVSAVCLYRI